MSGPFEAGWRQADVEAVIARGDPEELLHAPIVVSLDPPDGAWAQEVCLRLAAHPDENVRGNAILGFGHLARTWGGVDAARVQPLVVAALEDSSAFVRAQADAAKSDLAFFQGWRFAS